MKIHSKIAVFTRFVNPTIKKEMEIMANKKENGKIFYLTAEISKLFEPGYEGLWIEEGVFMEKLNSKQIVITKNPNP